MSDYTPAMLAQLEAQRAYFASDEHIRREVAAWEDSTPEERLAEVAEMCKIADYFLSQLEPEALERALAREPMPADTESVFAALRHRR
jgi:hypothetical protein